MGTIIFIFLHLIAVLFGFWMLIITIPLHIVYSNSKKSKKELKKQTKIMQQQVEELKKQKQD